MHVLYVVLSLEITWETPKSYGQSAWNLENKTGKNYFLINSNFPACARLPCWVNSNSGTHFRPGIHRLFMVSDFDPHPCPQTSSRVSTVENVDRKANSPFEIVCFAPNTPCIETVEITLIVESSTNTFHSLSPNYHKKLNQTDDSLSTPGCATANISPWNNLSNESRHFQIIMHSNCGYP